MEKESFSFNESKATKEILKDFQNNFIDFIRENYVKADIINNDVKSFDLKKGMVVTFKSTIRGDFSSDPILIYDDFKDSISKGKLEKKTSKSNNWCLLGYIDLNLKYKGYRIDEICRS